MNDAHHTSPTPRPRPGGVATIAGHTVARIGYGAMQLDRLAHDHDLARRVIRRAIDLGVTHIDTAQYYGGGFSNTLLREAVHPEDEVTIVTKVGWETDENAPLGLRLAQRPEELRASVRENLDTLGLDQLPVVNLRRFESGLPMTPPADQIVDLEDQLAEMAALRDEGLIGAIGLSTVTIDSVRRALPVGIADVSNAYSLVDRSDEELAQLCRAEGIAWVPYFPLGSAFPGFPKVVDEEAVQSVARQLGATPAQVGLAWLLHHSDHTLLIPGTSSMEHLEANLRAGDIALDSAQMDELDRISLDATAS